MLYGPDSGDTRLREALASWLSDFYAPDEPIHAARITITGGASQNLGCVVQTFTDPVYTRNVWMVSPTYMLVFRIFDDAGLHHKLRAIPEDDEGIDMEYLKRELEKSEQKARAEGNNHPVRVAICPCQVQLCVRNIRLRGCVYHHYPNFPENHSRS
jgi:DNA-binding transcriptional MocR family regulator